MSIGRYVSADWRRYAHPNGCGWCGSGVAGNHRLTVCMACGVPQCHATHSTCRACFVGWLPGWSRGWSRGISLGPDARLCGYKDCGEPAVADAPRVGRVCAEHLHRAKRQRVTVAEYIDDNRHAALRSTGYREQWRRMVWRPAAGFENDPEPDLPKVGQVPTP